MVTGGRARWGQLLLFAALLFGIATMHTVGHPSPGHGSGHGSGFGSGPAWAAAGDHVMPGGEAAQAVTHAGHATPGTAAAVAAESQAAGHGVGPASAVADGRATPGGEDHAPPGIAERVAVEESAPGHDGMDPASVCLAVLGAWGVALLVARLLTRHPADRLPAVARARLLHSVRPNPPPPRTVLTRLSILRI